MHIVSHETVQYFHETLLLNRLWVLAEEWRWAVLSEHKVKPLNLSLEVYYWPWKQQFDKIFFAQSQLTGKTDPFLKLSPDLVFFKLPATSHGLRAAENFQTVIFFSDLKKDVVTLVMKLHHIVIWCNSVCVQGSNRPWKFLKFVLWILYILVLKEDISG